MNAPKTAFFDVDGTLAAPVYRENGRAVTGFLGKAWTRYCDGARERTYDDVPLVEPVVAFALRLLAAGWDIKVLTVTLSDGERVAKSAWLENKRIADMFSQTIFVPSDRDKMQYLRDYVARMGVAPSDCLLVEDSYANVLEANAIGMRTAHVSHIAAGMADTLAGLSPAQRKRS